MIYYSTNAALESASSFASDLLRSPRPFGDLSSNRSQHDHHYWGAPGWGWGYPQPVYCRPVNGGQTNDKRDHSWVALPAAAIALGTMYFLGQNYAEWSSAKRAISKLHQRNAEVRLELNRTNAPSSLKNSIQLVFRKQWELLDQIRSDSLKGLSLKIILVTSVIIAGIGALASGNILFASSFTPWLPYGCISTFITAAAMLYRAGLQSRNESLQEDARELQIAIAQSSQILHSL